MESKRQQKFSRVIQKELSEVMQKEGLSFYEGSIVTITAVRCTPDLSGARVYLSIFNAKNPLEVLKVIQVHTKDIRYKMGLSLKNHVRIIPNIEFFLDDSQEYAKHIDDLFKEIREKEDRKEE